MSAKIDRIATIRARLEQDLQPTQLDIIDDSHKHRSHAGASGGAGHYAVKIASPLFVNKSRVQQHQLIYQALGNMIPGEIHALKIVILASNNR